MSIKVTKNLFAIKGAEQAVKKLNIEACIKIRANAVPLMAVDKGQYRNSAMWVTEDEKGGFNDAGGELAPNDHELTVKPKKGEAYVGSGSDHWDSEFGTKYQIAQPAWRPAVELFQGNEAATVAKKYGAEAMKEAFAKRKVVVKNV